MRPKQKEDVQMTREEFIKLKKSLKDDKFHELLGDYMKEISDPKNVAEYDQYLEQLKAEGELPEPEFVVKSSLASQKEKRFEHSIYINICSHSAVDAPALQTVAGGRQQWQVPYLVGKARYDQETSSTIVTTVDVVFHPEAVATSLKHKEYKRLLCETSLDAAQAALQERKETVNRDYTLVPDLKCKGDQPALLPVTLDQAARERNRQARNKVPGTKIMNEIQDIKDEERKRKVDEAKNNQEDMQKPLVADEEEEVDVVQEPNFDAGPIAPKYNLVYSYPIELGDFRNQADISEPVKQGGGSRPKEIKITVEVPKAEGLASLQVDLKPRRLKLECGQWYYLDLGLAFEVDTENAKAKFVSSKKVLELILPVVPKAELEVKRPVWVEPIEDKEEETIDTESQIPVTVDPRPTESETEHISEPVVETPLTISKPSGIEELESTSVDPTKHSDKASTSVVGEPAENNKSFVQPKPVETLAHNHLLAPTITALSDCTVYLLRVPGLGNATDDYRVTQACNKDELLVSVDKPDRYFHLSNLAGAKATIKVMKEYISITVEGEKGQVEPKVGDQSEEQMVNIKAKLEQERLDEEVKAAEEAKNRIAEVETPEIPHYEVQNNASDSLVETSKQESIETEQSQKDNQISQETAISADKPEEDQATTARYGYQLLDLLLMEKACEID